MVRRGLSTGVGARRATQVVHMQSAIPTLRHFAHVVKAPPPHRVRCQLGQACPNRPGFFPEARCRCHNVWHARPDPEKCWRRRWRGGRRPHFGLSSAQVFSAYNDAADRSHRRIFGSGLYRPRRGSPASFRPKNPFLPRENDPFEYLRGGGRQTGRRRQLVITTMPAVLSCVPAFQRTWSHANPPPFG